MQTLTSIPKTENQPTPFNLSTPQGLLSILQELRQTVETEGKATFDQWRSLKKLFLKPIKLKIPTGPC
jgi:hypothetical protein